jgi:hypothetical protein
VEQHLGEQVVVAIPDPVVVQRHDEEAGRLQPLEHHLACRRHATHVRGPYPVGRIVVACSEQRVAQ